MATTTTTPTKRKRGGDATASNKAGRKKQKVDPEAEPEAETEPQSEHPFASLNGKRYDIILADAPWEYSNSGNSGAASKHYSTMSIADIAALPVQDICNPGAFLLMWATAPLLAEALAVIKAWGFEYKTVFSVWVKVKAGTQEPVKNGIGHYTRSACEYVFIARRKDGKQPLKDVRASQSVGQVILAPRREHSRKPDEMFERINEFFKPELTRIELFAREGRVGYDCWGNQCSKFGSTKEDGAEAASDE
jgi:N6-adenosine-specific RNA methylase IME4